MKKRFWDNTQSNNSKLFCLGLDIEEGKGIGGESIYGPFFEGRLLKCKAVFV